MSGTAVEHGRARTLSRGRGGPFEDTAGDGKGSNAFLFGLTAIASIGGALFGYDTGVVSGAMIQIKSDGARYPEVGGFDLGNFGQELVVSITIAGAAIGSVSSGPLNDSVGRRPVAVACSVIFACACLVMAVAPSLGWLVAGRLLVGVGVGMAATTVPMYIAEVSPPAKRGRLVSVNAVSIVIGQVLAGLVDCYFGLAKVPQGWRYMLGLGGVPAVIMCAGFTCCLPESPRWLLQQGREEAARECLILLRGREDVGSELSAIRDAVYSEAGGGNARDMLASLSRPGVRRALALGCGLQLLQQLVGINTLMYYSATILQAGVRANKAGGSEDPSDDPWYWENNEVICLSSLTAFSQAVGCTASIFLVDRLGRRVLTLSSLAIAVCALLLLGFAYYGIPPGKTSFPLAVCSMCVYLLAFGFGMAPMPWVINSEIYPLEVRATCVGMATCVNWAANFAVAMTFLDIASALSTDRRDPGSHPDGAFWLYGGFGALGWLLLFRYMPETKGVPIEKVTELFGGDSGGAAAPAASSAERQPLLNHTDRWPH